MKLGSSLTVFALFLSIAVFSPNWGYGEETLLSSFGTGSIKVSIYTDYFCPPCRNLEIQLEPLILDLVKKGAVHLIFVDTPVHQLSALYAQYFLFALNHRRDFPHAVYVRNTLFSAAMNQIRERKKLEEFLREKGIAFTPFDVSGVFEAWNRSLQEDKINATPSVVIAREGKKEIFKGAKEILKGLNELK